VEVLSDAKNLPFMVCQFFGEVEDPNEGFKTENLILLIRLSS
jgi:hypothetical protein